MQADEAIRLTTHILRRLYLREKHWLGSRTPSQLSRLNQQGELSLSEQLHYGEIAFVLLGLKPCAIIDYSGDREQLAEYISKVIHPSLAELNEVGSSLARAAVAADGERRAGGFPRGFRIACERIQGPLSSPEIPSWTGAFVLWDAMLADSDRWVMANLLDPRRTLIEEDELALGLDYPGSLPKDPHEMRSIVPISYLGRMKDESGEWMCDRWECLTSFVVLQHQLPQAAHHRMRYQSVKTFDIEMQVNMDTSLIDVFQV